MSDVFDVKPGDRVRIVLEGTVRTVVAYPHQSRVDILLDEDEEGFHGAGVHWFQDRFAPEQLVVFDNEKES